MGKGTRYHYDCELGVDAHYKVAPTYGMEHDKENVITADYGTFDVMENNDIRVDVSLVVKRQDGNVIGRFDKELSDDALGVHKVKSVSKGLAHDVATWAVSELFDAGLMEKECRHNPAAQQGHPIVIQ